MKQRSLAIYMLGLLSLLGILFLGLNMVEQGMRELMALDEPARSFVFSIENGDVMVTFAARDFVFPYSEYIDRLYSIFSFLN